MPKRKKKDKSFVRRLLGLRVILVVNVVILIFLTLSFGREFVRNYKIEKDVEELRQTAQSLEARNLKIAELHTQMQTESFIEREARLKLGLKKPGERVIVVQEEEVEGGADNLQETAKQVSETPERPIKDSSDKTERVSNAKKWWYYFFDQQSFEQITYESRKSRD